MRVFEQNFMNVFCRSHLLKYWSLMKKNVRKLKMNVTWKRNDNRLLHGWKEKKRLWPAQWLKWQIEGRIREMMIGEREMTEETAGEKETGMRKEMRKGTVKGIHFDLYMWGEWIHFQGKLLYYMHCYFCFPCQWWSTLRGNSLLTNSFL